MAFSPLLTLLLISSLGGVDAATRLKEDASVGAGRLRGVPPCNEIVPFAGNLHASAIKKGELLVDLHTSSNSLKQVLDITKSAKAELQKDAKQQYIPEDISKKYDAEVKRAEKVLEDAGKDSSKVQELSNSVAAIKVGQDISRNIELSVRAEKDAAGFVHREAQRVKQETSNLHREVSDATGNMFDRVWFACKGPEVQANALFEHTGIKVVNKMECTDHMTYKRLCCARWKDEDFKHNSTLQLKSAQEPQEQAATPPSGNIIKLCTQSVNGVSILSRAAASSPDHTASAEMPVQCFVQHVSLSELGLGQIFLQLRILFFVKQGIPVSSIPTCATEVATCPDGKAPATVSNDFLRKAKKNSALLETIDNNNNNNARFATGMMGDEDLGQDIVMKGDRFHY